MSLRLKVASLIGKYAVLIGATAITINTVYLADRIKNIDDGNK